ncbi:MAG: HEAT repeat domain-containing protein [Candidatus Omnitrophota bacterium]
MFKKKGISYISILPNFANDKGYESPYFTLLSGREKGMVEKLSAIIASAMLPIPERLIGSEEMRKALSDVLSENDVIALKAAVYIQSLVEQDKEVRITGEGIPAPGLVFGEGEVIEITVTELLSRVKSGAPASTTPLSMKDVTSFDELDAFINAKRPEMEKEKVDEIIKAVKIFKEELDARRANGDKSNPASNHITRGNNTPLEGLRNMVIKLANQIMPAEVKRTIVTPETSPVSVPQAPQLEMERPVGPDKLPITEAAGIRLKPRVPVIVTYAAPFDVQLAQNTLKVYSRDDVGTVNEAILEQSKADFFIVDPVSPKIWQAFKPGEKKTLGSSKKWGDFILLDNVEGTHASIKMTEGGNFIITDLGSMNGTWIIPGASPVSVLLPGMSEAAAPPLTIAPEAAQPVISEGKYLVSKSGTRRRIIAILPDGNVSLERTDMAGNVTKETMTMKNIMLNLEDGRITIESGRGLASSPAVAPEAAQPVIQEGDSLVGKDGLKKKVHQIFPDGRVVLLSIDPAGKDAAEIQTMKVIAASIALGELTVEPGLGLASSRGLSGFANEVYSPYIKNAIDEQRFSSVSADIVNARFVQGALTLDDGQTLQGNSLTTAQIKILNKAKDLLSAEDRVLLAGATLLFINDLDAQIIKEVALRAASEGRAPPESCYGTHYGIQRNQYYIDLIHLDDPDPQELTRHLYHGIQERKFVLDGLTPEEQVIVLGGMDRSPDLITRIDDLARTAHEEIMQREETMKKLKDLVTELGSMPIAKEPGNEKLLGGFKSCIDLVYDIGEGKWRGDNGEYNMASEVKWHDFTHAGKNTLETIRAMRTKIEGIPQDKRQDFFRTILLTGIAGMSHDIGYYREDDNGFGTIKVDHEKRSMDFVVKYGELFGITEDIDKAIICLIISSTEATVRPEFWDKLDKLIQGKDHVSIEKQVKTNIPENMPFEVNDEAINLLENTSYVARLLGSLDIYDTRDNAIEMMDRLRDEFQRDKDILMMWLKFSDNDLQSYRDLKTRDENAIMGKARELGVNVPENKAKLFTKAINELLKLAVSNSHAKQVAGTQGFYKFFADERVAGFDVWEDVPSVARNTFNITREVVRIVSEKTMEGRLDILALRKEAAEKVAATVAIAPAAAPVIATPTTLTMPYEGGLNSALLKKAQQIDPLSLSGGGIEIYVQINKHTGAYYKCIYTSDIKPGDLPSGYSTLPGVSLKDAPAAFSDVPASLAEVKRTEVVFPDTDVFLTSKEGDGSTGVVRLGFLKDTGRPVAVKVDYDDLVVNKEADEEYVFDAYRAGQMAYELGIGPMMHGLCEEDGRLGIVMDIIPGDGAEIMPGYITEGTVKELFEVRARLRIHGLSMEGDYHIFVTPEGHIQLLDPKSLLILSRLPDDDLTPLVRHVIPLLISADNEVRRNAGAYIVRYKPETAKKILDTIESMLSKMKRSPGSSDVTINAMEEIKEILTRGTAKEMRDEQNEAKMREAAENASAVLETKQALREAILLISRLESMMKDTDNWSDQVTALASFSVIYPKLYQNGYITIKKLKSMLKDTNYDIRMVAAESLGAIYPKLYEEGKITLEELESMLEDPENWAVKLASVISLGVIYPNLSSIDQKRIIIKLESMLKNKSLEVQRALATSLGAIYSKLYEERKITLEELESMLEDPENWAVKLASVISLGAIYPNLSSIDQKRIFEKIESMLENHDIWTVRLAAVTILGSIYLKLNPIYQKRILRKLEFMLNDPNRNVCQALATTLSGIYANQITDTFSKHAETLSRYPGDNSMSVYLKLQAASSGLPEDTLIEGLRNLRALLAEKNKTLEESRRIDEVKFWEEATATVVILSDIMGKDAFVFLEGFLNANPFSLNRFLEAAKLYDLDTIEGLKVLYSSSRRKDPGSLQKILEISGAYRDLNNTDTFISIIDNASKESIPLSETYNTLAKRYLEDLARSVGVDAHP